MPEKPRGKSLSECPAAEAVVDHVAKLTDAVRIIHEHLYDPDAGICKYVKAAQAAYAIPETPDKPREID